MGILNLTPDSFYADSRATEPDVALKRFLEMQRDGADIIDIGACSTRPGAIPPGEDEEMRRLENVMDMLTAVSRDIVISIDTFRASVAEECLRKWKVGIINDVSGGRDPEMFATVARHKAIYVLTHSRGDSANMDSLCEYGDDVTAGVIRELAFRLNEARLRGICNILVDPGFGFAKTMEQNYALLNNLERFKVLGCPVLVGMSRKRMIGRDIDSLTGTVALNAVAVSKGATVIRVHDVKQGVATVATAGKLWNFG